MATLLSKLLWPLLNPGSLILYGLIAGPVLRLVPPLRGFGLWLTRLCFVLLILVALVPSGTLLMRPLEEFYPVADLPDRVNGIILLGGAEQPDLSATRGLPQMNGGAEREFSFIELARRYPEAKLVFTGGVRAARDPSYGEAEVAREIQLRLGLDPTRVTYEREALNTYENAQNTARLMQPKAGETWLLVTSAVHMPRAMLSFQAVGWPVLPVPVDFHTMPAGHDAWLRFDPLGGLNGLNAAAKEWLGLAYYRILGRTQRFLPEKP